MASAKALIEAGGTAEWQFIVFRHNEHQIQDAMNLAKTMGFKRFNIVKTTRFFGGTEVKSTCSINKVKRNMRLSRPGI